MFELVYSRLTLAHARPDGPARPGGVLDDLAATARPTFRLRAAKFHNGDPVTAQDVKFTFERIVTDEGSVAQRLVRRHRHDRRAGPSHRGLPAQAAERRLLPYLAHPNASIVSAKVAQAASNDLSKKEHAIGSGPFRLARVGARQLHALRGQPRVLRPGQPYLDGVRINIVPDEAGIVAALRTKAADMALIADARIAQTLAPGGGRHRQRQAEPELPPPVPQHQAEAARQPQGAPGDRVRDRPEADHRHGRPRQGGITGPLAPALDAVRAPGGRVPELPARRRQGPQLLQEAGVGPVSSRS